MEDLTLNSQEGYQPSLLLAELTRDAVTVAHHCRP